MLYIMRHGRTDWNVRHKLQGRTDIPNNEKYMKNVIDKAEDIKIVGVLQPKEGVSAYMLQTGIYYPVELTTHVIENAENSKIVKEQLKSPKVDVFTGKKFGEDDDSSSFDMNSLFEIDTNAMISSM